MPAIVIVTGALLAAERRSQSARARVSVVEAGNQRRRGSGLGIVGRFHWQ
jgi:hypothetical protein